MKATFSILISVVFVGQAWADKLDLAPTLDAMAVYGGSVSDRGAAFSAGFETPYTTGFLGTQQGWTSWTGGTVAQAQPTIVTTGTPYAGTRHLRFARNGTALQNGYYYGADTPLLSPAYEAGQTATVSIQTKIVQTGGADYYIELSDSVSGTISARIDFYYASTRNIRVFDYSGADPNAPYVWYDTGATWTANTYKELKVVQTLNSSVQYYYGGVLIYDDVNGTNAATRMDTVTLFCDNFQVNTTSDFGYFDNLSITPEPASIAMLALMALVRRR